MAGFRFWCRVPFLLQEFLRILRFLNLLCEFEVLYTGISTQVESKFFLEFMNFSSRLFCTLRLRPQNKGIFLMGFQQKNSHMVLFSAALKFHCQS